MRKPASGIRLIKTYHLPTGVRWSSACETSRNFFAVGSRDNEVVVARGAWDDPSATVSSVAWSRFHGEASNVSICHSTTDRTLCMASTGTWRFEPREFQVTDVNPDRIIALSPSWMPKSVSALAFAPNGTAYTFQMMQLLLSGFSQQRHQTICETLPLPIMADTYDPDTTYRMVARDDAVYLAFEGHLIESRPGSAVSVRQLRGPIMGLASSPPRVRNCVAVFYQDEGELFWGVLEANRNHRFALGVTDPIGVILNNGQLVVHGREGWRAYHFEEDKIHRNSEWPSDSKGDVFGLLRSGAARQVGLCTTAGQVEVYELP